MQEIVELAEKLGSLLAKEPAVRAFVQARKSVDDDKQAQQLLKDYEAQARRIGELEASGKPVEPEDKHKLSDLQSQISSNELIKKFLQAQVEYMDVIRKVNERINQHLGQ